MIFLFVLIIFRIFTQNYYMAYISIEYNEPNQNEYKSVKVGLSNKTETKFNSGNFIKDWFECLKFIANQDNNEHTICSSTVDHFITDGDKYESAYLHTNRTEDGELLYIDETDPNWIHTQDWITKGIEIFVPTNTKPTWEQFKQIIKNS